MWLFLFLCGSFLFLVNSPSFTVFNIKQPENSIIMYVYRYKDILVFHFQRISIMMMMIDDGVAARRGGR